MEIKQFAAEIKATKDSGEFEAILSMPTLDRDMEVVDARAFEPLPDHIPIDIDHGMSVTSTVGSGVPFYEGDVLKVRGTFASTPLGQEVRTLVTEGHVRKMSVAYMGSQYEADETDGFLHLRKGELLNAAIVAIPSNRQADILTAKSAELAIEKQSKSASLQQIHDLAAAAGAECKAAPAAASKLGITINGPIDGSKVAAAVEQHLATGGFIKTSTEQTPKDPAAAAGSSLADAQVALARAAAVAAEAALLTT